MSHYEWRCGVCGSSARYDGYDRDMRDSILKFGDSHRCAGTPDVANMRALLAEARDYLQRVRGLVRTARQVSPSDRAVLYVTDVEVALGLRPGDTPEVRKLGGNDGSGQ